MNGYAMISFMNIVIKLEQYGVTEIYQTVQSIFSDILPDDDVVS